MGDCDVVVVGAGVSGLTTAICLAEDGLTVEVLAAEPPARTTSAVAGAIWGPHLIEDSPRTARWRQETLAVLMELAGDPATGVRVIEGVEASRGGPGEAAPPAGEPVPDWLLELGGAARCAAGSLPAGFVSGWRYAAPLAHMPAYLDYLLARLLAADGRVVIGRVASLAGPALQRGARAVVNCTGTGARDLVPDPLVIPYRGQALVAVNPGITEFFIGPEDANSDLVYLFPHGDTVVLGGTKTAGDWNAEPVLASADRIMRDCAAIEPRLLGARILAHRVGLRPYRPRVRLEAESPGTGLPGPLVVHNYGHGGAGVTVSWGCAREAAALVRSALAAAAP